MRNALLRSLISTLLIALFGILTFSAAPTFAAEAECEGCTPWWHLTSESRPSIIQPGSAKDEVQQVTVSRTEGIYLAVALGSETILEAGESPEHVREALEGRGALVGEMYGPGNVEVTAKAGPNSEFEVYEIRFMGKLADQPLALMEVPEIGIGSEVSVKQLTAGRPDGEIVVKAENVGDAATSANAPVRISDLVPAGFEAVGISGGRPKGGGAQAMSCKLETLSCEWASGLPPFAELEVRIEVLAKSKLPSCEADLVACELGRVTVSGGEAAAASLARPLVTGEKPAQFGLADYELLNEQEGGAPVTQAGAHPFQQTNVIDLNQGVDAGPLATHQPEVLSAGGLAKDLRFNWPAGLIGNPSAFPQCSEIDFLTRPERRTENLCPADTAVGVVTFDIDEPRDFGVLTDTVPLFNLEPDRGEPARFGFYEPTGEAAAYIDAHVRSGRDYGVTVSSTNITETISFLSAHVTVWGTPGDPRHDASRGWACLDASGARPEEPHPCSRPVEPHPPAFLSMPTACPRDNPVTHQPEPLQSTAEGDSWTHPGTLEHLATYIMPAPDGCNQLPFEPQVKVTPDGTAASTPTGLNVDVHLPQEETLNSEGLAISAPRDITVALPPGVAVNPASGDGLAACSEGLVDFEGFQELTPGFSPATFKPYLPGTVAAREAGDFESLLQGTNVCPDAAKVATATIHTPILPHPVAGAVYLATQNQNPFGSLLAMYIVAEDRISGILVKLPGEVSLCKNVGEDLPAREGVTKLRCEALGQLITTFENSPQAPFEDAELHFFGGERAPLATPARCGPYTTTASFAPWSGNAPVVSTSTFNITSGPNGAPCPGSSLPFKPTLTGGATNVNAGAFSPFTATFSRLSGEQNMQSIEAKLPPGLSGVLSNIELCPEPQANLGECSENSLIGETTVSVGVGGEPYTVSGGKFYLTGPYNGTGSCTVGTPNCAPFGITFEVPAKAGPFDFANTPNNHPPCDCVLVRGKIEINPITAAITITSNPPGTPDAIPTSIEGIPLEIQHINAITTRGNFQFNPTNCNKMDVTGTIRSSEGTADAIGVPFQVTNCKSLAFIPSFTATTTGRTSKADGASLTLKVTRPTGPESGQANFAKAKIDLPKQLPSRLTTLQKACLAVVFEHDPAGCPPASIVGHVKVITPILPVPLEGPAYFVSHGNEAFPSLTMVLQGYGVTLQVVSATFIKKGITSGTLNSVPDAPFSTFELTLPQGPDSALAANANLCTGKLRMPTAFVAQNGLEIHETTPIAVTGCPRPLTRVQQLAKTLKACRKKKPTRRAACEQRARKQRDRK